MGSVKLSVSEKAPNWLKTMV